ncbi:MAG: PilN domain-containing protein [Desulfuromonadales bacterium]
MIRINLLPIKAAKKTEQLRVQVIILLLSVGIVLIGCAGVYAALQVRIGTEKKNIARTESEIGKLQKSIGEVAHFKKLQSDLRGKLDVLDKLKEGKSGPVHILDELSQAMPEKVWLTSFKESDGAVSISGLGINEETVARFMQDLEASPYFQDVELKVIEQHSQGPLKLQKFQVSCRVQAPPKTPSN